MSKDVELSIFMCLFSLFISSLVKYFCSLTKIFFYFIIEFWELFTHSDKCPYSICILQVFSPFLSLFITLLKPFEEVFNCWNAVYQFVILWIKPLVSYIRNFLLESKDFFHILSSRRIISAFTGQFSFFIYFLYIWLTRLWIRNQKPKSFLLCSEKLIVKNGC